MKRASRKPSPKPNRKNSQKFQSFRSLARSSTARSCQSRGCPNTFSAHLANMETLRKEQRLKMCCSEKHRISVLSSSEAVECSLHSTTFALQTALSEILLTIERFEL